MNSVYKSIEIDLYSPTSYEVIKAQQGDKNSRILEFKLYNQGEPYVITDGVSLQFIGQRGDGSYFFKDKNDNCITFENNKIMVSLTDDILYYAGIIEAKLVMFDDITGNVLSTVPFKISCIKSPCDESSLSEGEKSKIADLIFQVKAFSKNAEKIVSDAKEYADASYENKTQAESLRNETARHENYARQYAENAEQCVGWAENYSNMSENYRDEALGYANDAQSYAVGTNGYFRPGDDTDCAKHYYEQSKQILDSISDIGAVVGVKGNAETEFRNGLVNITAENVGALPVDGIAKNAEKLGGYPVSKGSSDSPYGCIPRVQKVDGVMEVGKYIDFHATDESKDYDVRMDADGTGLTISGITKGIFSGNLTGNATTATKATQDGNGDVITDTYARKTEALPLKISATKSMTITTTGAWYRLGYFKNCADFWGTFTVTHSWGNDQTPVSRFMAGASVAAAAYNNAKAQEIYFIGEWGENRVVKKVRLIWMPVATTACNIYVDVFIQGAYNSLGNDGWYYYLETDTKHINMWVDSNFAIGATVPTDLYNNTAYISKEFEFTDATAGGTYTHPTEAGYKHIPTGGATYQGLFYSGFSGTATWQYPNRLYGSTSASTYYAYMSNGVFLPASSASSSYAIGSSASRWYYGYFKYLYTTYSITATNLVTTGSISEASQTLESRYLRRKILFDGMYNGTPSLVYTPSAITEMYNSVVATGSGCGFSGCSSGIIDYGKTVNYIRVRIVGMDGDSGNTLDEEVMLYDVHDSCGRPSLYTTSRILYLKDYEGNTYSSIAYVIVSFYEANNCGNQGLVVRMSPSACNLGFYITRIELVK